MARAKIPQPLRFLSSYGLCIILLILLMLLTIAGTVDQASLGLYRAQVKYFQAGIAWWQPAQDVPVGIPLPGAYLVFAALTLNLVCALLVRFRWRWKNFGLVISHLGLLMLMTGSFVTFHMSQDGAVSFKEGELGKAFDSYHEYVFKLIDTNDPQMDQVVEFPGSYIHAGSALEKPELLPFRVVLEELYDNTEAIPRGQIGADSLLLGRGSHGVRPVERLLDNELNRPGARVAVYEEGAAEPIVRGMLLSDVPSPITVQGRKFSLLYERKRTGLPFALRLLSTRRELHPGTSMPRHFESRVLLIDGGIEREVLIQMNEPLRYQGYTFFQSGYDELEDGSKVSVLAVMQNPAELVPYISCGLVFLGMVLHFAFKLAVFLARRGRTGS